MSVGKPAMNWRRLSGTFIALLYFAFGLTDLILSQAAFAVGIPEGNPVLAWMMSHGLFIPAKIGLTAIVSLLIRALYPLTRIRPLAYSAVLLMALVDAYHVWALNALLAAG